MNVRRTYINLNDYPKDSIIPVKNIEDNILAKNVQDNHSDMCLKWDNLKEHSTTNPSKWGPSFWYILHNAASHYQTRNASPICISRIKGFILGIPYMLPCQSCSEHARTYIDSKSKELDTICSSKESLFNFFFEFHNFVNKHTGKPEMSKDYVKKLYNY